MAFGLLAQLLIAALLGLFAVVLAVLWVLRDLLLAPFRSTLLNLPGPPSPSWFYGNFKQIFESEGESARDEWLNQYGDTIAYRAWFNVRPMV